MNLRLWPEFWIHHPAADGAPVGLRRWLYWHWAEFLEAVIHRLGRRRAIAEQRALYPNDPLTDDDIPF